MADAGPKFDVEGFYDRARRIMKERTAPLVDERNKEIKKNLSAMEREYKRMIRKISDAKKQKEALDALKVHVIVCESNGNRIPDELDKKFSEVSEVKVIHEEYRAKQKAIDAKMVAEVAMLSTTYLQGLQKQVERLTAEKDTAAVKLIEEEIKKVSGDVEYFPLLMLDQDDPAIAKPPPPKDKKDEKK